MNCADRRDEAKPCRTAEVSTGEANVFFCDEEKEGEEGGRLSAGFCCSDNRNSLGFKG